MLFKYIDIQSEHSSSMAESLAPTAECLGNHIAVRFKDFILVLSETSSIEFSRSKRTQVVVSHYSIWMYNLWTEQWRKLTMPKEQELPGVYDRTGVVIGTDAYIFGGHDHKNMLWKLIANAEGSFVWSIIQVEEQTKVPSPRLNHCAWEHGDKMWVFGGTGPSPVDYLNNHGDFIPVLSLNNQLFFYEPTTETWINIQCSGEVPLPRHSASTAIIQDNVWLYGGRTKNSNCSDDLYELNMHSFTWTQIKTTMPGPNGSNRASLTPISASQLLLYGGNLDMFGQKFTIPWIYNVQTHTWSLRPTVGKSSQMEPRRHNWFKQQCYNPWWGK